MEKALKIYLEHKSGLKEIISNHPVWEHYFRFSAKCTLTFKVLSRLLGLDRVYNHSECMLHSSGIVYTGMSIYLVMCAPVVIESVDGYA